MLFRSPALPQPAIQTPAVQTPAIQTTVFEPLRAARYSAPPPAAEPEPRYEAPEPALAAAAEPTVVQPQVRPIARIVDPSVADEEEAGPLFPETSHYGDERRRGGWLSIFGGRARHDAAPAPGPAMRSNGSAHPAAQPLPAESSADPDDLEIPSFLRRLAN